MTTSPQSPQGPQRPLAYNSYYSLLRSFYQQPAAAVSSALILTLFAIAFFGVFAIRPSLTTISELLKQIEEKRILEEQLTTKITSLAAAQEEFLQFESQLAVFDQLIPPSDDIDALLLSLEFLAQQESVALTNLSTNNIPTHTTSPELPTLPGDDFASIQVRISAVGEQDRLISFQKRLANQRRFMVIEAASIAIPQGQEARQFVQNANDKSLDLALRAYFGPPQTHNQPSSKEVTNNNQTLDQEF